MVRNAAFFTPFRGWRHLDGVPYSERPPTITGVKSSGGATLVMENVVCKGLWRCLDSEDWFFGPSDHVTLADSLFVDNYEAVHAMVVFYSVVSPATSVRLTRSVFFSNGVGAYLHCYLSTFCHVDQSLFLQNDVGIQAYSPAYNSLVQVAHTTLAQNEQAVQVGSGIGSFNGLLFYKNDVASNSRGTLGNATFLENQADSCAGQCEQSWFNTNWSSLISAGTGSFGFFDPDRSLHSGQVLRDALLKGHEAPSGMPLSSYMQDLSDLFGAVSKFLTVGTSTSPLPSTTASLAVSTTASTTRSEMRSGSLEKNALEYAFP